MVEDEVGRKVRYEGLGFHDLRKANATALVAEGVDIKTAQGLLGNSSSRLTLDHDAQVVTEQGQQRPKPWDDGSCNRRRSIDERRRALERASGGTEMTSRVVVEK